MHQKKQVSKIPYGTKHFTLYPLEFFIYGTECVFTAFAESLDYQSRTILLNAHRPACGHDIILKIHLV